MLQKGHCGAFGHPRIAVDNHGFFHRQLPQGPKSWPQVTNSALYSRIPCVVLSPRRDNATLGSRRMFLTFWCIARWPITNSAPSIPTHTTVTWGLRLGLSVVKRANGAFFDHVAYCLWNLRGCLSFDALGPEPRRSCSTKHEKHYQRLLTGDMVLVVANEPGDALKQTTHGQL